MNMNRVSSWYNMDGRVVVLTGAAGKLGRYYCDILSEVGANVVVVDVEQAPCDELAAAIKEKHGTDPMGLALDVADAELVKIGVQRIFDKYGRIDVLINNAAAYQTTIVDGKAVTFENYPLELWQANLDVNLTGAFLMSQAVGKFMEVSESGVILNIGSAYGVVACDQRIYGDSGINSSVGYAATKGGLINFSRYLASYWQGKDIRVNCISPGGVYASQPEPFLSNYLDKLMIKRMADMDDLGSAVLYLISDASRWVTGTNLIVDGGLSAW
jgi:NAD(P)-dependent dehydrogenase (short-subunit alcohol dehydrogenase family)